MSNTRYVSIKRKIKDISEEDKAILLNAMNYRHFMYNKMIEISRKCIFKDGTNEFKPVEEQIKVTSYTLSKVFHHQYEKTDALQRHKTIPKKIRSYVAKDVIRSVKAFEANIKKGIYANIRFKKFNPNYRSFRVENPPGGANRIKLITDKNISFKAYGGNKTGIEQKFIHFTLCESIYDKKPKYTFNTNDIKTISFIYDKQELYIVFQVKLENGFNLIENIENVELIHPKAGIDMGIRNPITFYDGEKTHVVKFPHKKCKRIEKRIAILQEIQSKKQINSNNYFKLRLKIAKLHERKANIAKDWRNKVSHALANTFSHICVDEFNSSAIRKEDMITGKRNNINNKMLRVGYYYLGVTLRHMCDKYDCMFTLANPNTTRTCCICGHLNDPLSLTEEEFKCSKCGFTKHRDVNASVNCYQQIS